MCKDPTDGGDDLPSFVSDPSESDDRTIDQLLETIADRRSRLVLSYFDSASVDVVELDTLVDYLVECETEASMVEDLDAEEHRQRVAVALHHTHLPKLAADAFVDYDPRSKTIRYRGGDRVSACLELYDAVEKG